MDSHPSRKPFKTPQLSSYRLKKNYNSTKLINPIHTQPSNANQPHPQNKLQPNQLSSSKHLLHRNHSIKYLHHFQSSNNINTTSIQQTIINTPKNTLSIKKRIEIIKQNNPESQSIIKSQQNLTINRSKTKLKIKVRNPFEKRMKLQEQFEQSKIQYMQGQITDRYNNQIQEILKLMA